MRLLDQFHKLHAVLAEHGAQPGLPALAEALSCSERNARIVLRKMAERGWLRWEAARGRGHFSRLTLLESPQHAALDRLSGLLEKGELEQAFARLDGAQRRQLARRLPDFLRIADQDDARHRLRMPLYRAVESLDPYQVVSRLEAHLVRQIFARLTDFDAATQRVVPALAHHWEADPDARAWHFWLRPGLTFHDGTPLEPEDVRHTLLRMRDLPSFYQGLYPHLRHVETGPNRRVSCHLSATDHLWPQRLAAANASIIPRRRAPDFARMPVGSGPFKLTRHSDYRLTLAAFRDYYRERALLDEIDLWLLRPEDEPVAFDLQFGHSAASGTRARHAKVRLQSGCTYLVCNARRRRFADAQQRLALADWLAPDVLIDADDSARRRAAGLMPAWRHRIARPRKRPPLAEGTKLTMVSGDTPDERVRARLIQERLHAARIELRVRCLPYAELIRRDWLKHADLYLGNEILHDDEDFGCFEWFGADATFRRWMPAAPRHALDRRLQAIQSEPDRQARMRAYERIGKALVDEALLIPISHEYQQVDVEAHVAGIDALPLGFVSFADLWVR